MSLHGTLISANSDHRLKDIHVPRNQQEAGIHLMEWADRLPPSRSYLRDIAEGAIILAGVIGGAVICLAMTGH